MKNSAFDIAVLAGDGIGVEIMEACLGVLAALAGRVGGIELSLARLPGGAREYAVSGTALSEATFERCGRADAVLFGAMGWPDIRYPDGTEIAPQLELRSRFGLSAAVSLKSEEWAKDYNEIKDYGGKTSTKRSAQQTEDGRVWLLTGAPTCHPVARQIVIRKDMSVVDSARFMALVSIAAEDAYIAVFDAKYKYDLWRPITAIRNGDIDGNPATEREATWHPLDNTPMHPEYPCAHSITSAAVATVIETVLGTANVPELTLTSTTAPDVTHRWTNVRAYTDEVSATRIWAGFHYRFSTVVGQDMGRKIAAYAVKNVMQPVK